MKINPLNLIDPEDFYSCDCYLHDVENGDEKKLKDLFRAFIYKKHTYKLFYFLSPEFVLYPYEIRYRIRNILENHLNKHLSIYEFNSWDDITLATYFDEENEC